MGAGASVESLDDAKQVLKDEIGVSDSQAWKEASDIKDLKQAKTEIKRMRGLAAKFALNPSTSGGGGGGYKARGAVVDRLDISCYSRVQSLRRAFLGTEYSTCAGQPAWT